MDHEQEVELMHRFKQLSAVDENYWQDVDLTNKRNVSALIQENKNIGELLELLKQYPAGHSENYIYEWTKALSVCNKSDILKTLKSARADFYDDGYGFSFMMSMMKNIPLSLEEYQDVMSSSPSDFDADFVKRCFENRDLIFSCNNHYYATFFRELHHCEESSLNNFLNDFSRRMKKVAKEPQFAEHDGFTSLSDSLKKNETEFRKEAIKICDDMLKDFKIDHRRSSESYHDIKRTFPEIVAKVKEELFRKVIQYSLNMQKQYARTADILQTDDNMKDRYYAKDRDYDSRLIDDIVMSGLASPEDITLAADLFYRLNDRPETYGSCYNTFYITRENANLIKACRDVDDWMIPILVKVPHEIMGDVPGSPKKLFDACKAWKISKYIWKKEAVMIGKMPLKPRIVAAKIIDNMKKEFGYTDYASCSQEERAKEEWKTNKSLRAEFWNRFSEAQKMGWDKAFEMYCGDDKAAQLHLLAQKGRHASHEEFKFVKENLYLDKLFNSNVFSAQQRVMNILVSASAQQDHGISKEDAEAFRKPNAPEIIKEYIRNNRDWLIPASFNGAAIFKEYFPSYIKTIQNHNRRNPEDALSIHDAVYWLPEPMEKEANERFSQFIRKNIIYQNAEHKMVHRPLNELKIIAQNWQDLENKLQNEEENVDISKLKYNDVLSACMSVKYKNQRNNLFAIEAAKHGVPEHEYHNCEDIYLAGLKVPEPFDSKKKFKEGKYTGRFLPRDDPRALFFGDYTNCCQHFGGVGNSCAVSTVKHPFSQLFVIEDGQGKIIAGSWAWENTEGKYREVCFDNIEALGELQKRPEINTIYEQVGEYLTQEQNCHRVTIGLGYQDADVSKYLETESIALPKLYGKDGTNSYSDARSQVLLSENSNAQPLDKTQETQRYVRDVCYLDIEAMGRVSSAVFPDGDKELQAPENMAGFVIEDREKGVVGYCLYDKEEKSIYDMAVLPEYRTDKNASSKKLFAEMMRTITKEGGEWSAEMRDKTTLKYLEIMAERGLVKFEKRGIDHVMSDGSKVVAVTFTPIRRDVVNATAHARAKVKPQAENTAATTPLRPNNQSTPPRFTEIKSDERRA